MGVVEGPRDPQPAMITNPTTLDRLGILHMGFA
jgi:hypothetical protein